MNFSDIHNATVLVRIDANLPTLSDIFRLESAKPTIDALLRNGNRIILMSHWGRPNGSVVKSLSMRNLVPVMEKVFEEPVQYINQFGTQFLQESFTLAAQEIEQSSQANQRIFVLENTRFHPDEKSKNQAEQSQLAQQYATLGQFFVDDAFAVSHRKEATNAGIKQFLPWTKGLRHQLEINTLTSFKDNPTRPVTVILGGAKPDTKLTLIQSLLPITDTFLLGGLLAFTFLQADWENAGHTGQSPLVQDTPISTDFIPTAQQLLRDNPGKFVLPTDIVWQTTEDGTYGRDIGQNTIDMYTTYVQQSHTIFWNGPLGLDTPPFHVGTQRMIEIVGNSSAQTLIGGGDTAAAIPTSALPNFDFISTGGGATLDFLAQ